MAGKRLKPAAKDAAVRAKVEARLAADRALMARAAQVVAARAVPFERELLAMLKDRGLATDQAARLDAEFDKRDRGEARAARIKHRRSQVEALSLAGMPVGKIAKRLGLSYEYVVELRADLRVSRPRTRR